MVQLAPRQNTYLGTSTSFGSSTPFSEETARMIDAEVHRIIDECHSEAKRLLTAHRKQLDALVQALVARETLNEREILEVTGLPPAPELESAPMRAASGVAPNKAPAPLEH
jgi:cell division protease FtsH